MMMNNKLTPEHLQRAAIVYVRQSKPSQVIHHQESKRLQYSLQDRARSLGFQRVTVIDDDLGRTGSGLVDRPGFERLVGEVCSGQVGAVFCIEASRLARNGRDWHHLIELCGLVGILVIDPDGMYDPRLPNDRLLLGLKGTMSEFELHLFRQRSAEAILQKARRGELQFRVPIGLCWTPQGKIEIEADLRVQQAIRLVLEKFTELGSARQVLLAFRREGILLPVKQDDRWGSRVHWKPARYHVIVAIVKNPMYAGAYAFGKTEVRTNVVNGRARKTEGHSKPQDRWTVLIRDHHPGYISWEQFERNQLMLSENAYMKSRMGRKSGRGGRSLLAGLLRCRRCGRMLNIRFSGPGGNLPCFRCRSTLNHEVTQCVHFVGWRPDQAVSQEILRAIEGSAVQAAIEAADRMAQQNAEWQQALKLELEQARYEAQLAERRYESVDPAQRLVASELEARWNRALEKVQELENRLQAGASSPRPRPDKEALLALAEDLPAIWNAPETDMRLKQRLTRILIEEIVADVDEKTNEIVLVIHWAGGRHSELRVAKNKIGHHGHANKMEVLDIVRQMASQYSDEQIAATLNRLKLRTGWNNTWNKQRVHDLRNKLELAAFDEARANRKILTLEQTAERLHTSPEMIKRLIQAKLLPAMQIVPCAPWQIPEEAIESPAVVEAMKTMTGRRNVPRRQDPNTNQLTFSIS
jgi:DNA invertase Pin-like site-specific DNA recombinase